MDGAQVVTSPYDELGIEPLAIGLCLAWLFACAGVLGLAIWLLGGIRSARRER